jgi:hypothetical protein
MPARLCEQAYMSACSSEHAYMPACSREHVYFYGPVCFCEHACLCEHAYMTACLCEHIYSLHAHASVLMCILAEINTC